MEKLKLLMISTWIKTVDLSRRSKTSLRLSLWMDIAMEAIVATDSHRLLMNHLDRTPPLDRLDRTPPISHLDHLDRSPPLDHLDHLDRTPPISHLDRLDRTPPISHLDQLDRTPPIIHSRLPIILQAMAVLIPSTMEDIQRQH